MEKAFSIVMITALITPNLIKIGILIDFKINQDFISEVLCINKEKPMSTCNGKCYLSEKLKKAEERQEKQVPINNKERVEVLYYYSKRSFDVPIYDDFFVSELNSPYIDEIYTSLFISDIFHPPKPDLI